LFERIDSGLGLHELEFAIVQSDVAYDAYHGKGAYSEAPFPALRSVLALHPEFVTIVARAGIHELGDLAGKRIVAGPAGSGSRATWEAMVKALGWKDGQAPRTVDMPVDAIGTALCKGSIDASLLVLGHPSSKIRDLLASCALNLIPADGPAIDALVAAAPYLKRGRIPASAYALPADIPSFGVDAILMTTADMDARVVSDFALSLGTQIKALQDKSPVLANLTAQDIITEALPVPLHPAALEVYRKLQLLN
jgi:TRAP transporter TAXI family solute receptor